MLHRLPDPRHLESALPGRPRRDLFKTQETRSLATRVSRSATVGLLGHQVRRSLDELISIGRIAIEIKDKKELTEFLAIELELKSLSRPVRFLVQAEADFNKQEREDSVLQDLIQNEADFWQCFRFLVEGDGGLLPGWTWEGGEAGKGPRDGSGKVPAGILESLLRECARDPDRVLRVRRLLDLAPSQVKTKELSAFWSAFEGAFTEVKDLDL